MDPVSKARIGGSSDGKAKRLANLKPPWPKGVSGNPSGRPKKTPVTKAMQRFANSRKGQLLMQESIRAIIDKQGMAAVLLMREIAERLEGKVTDTIDMNVTGTVALAEVIAERRKKRGNTER